MSCLKKLALVKEILFVLLRFSFEKIEWFVISYLYWQVMDNQEAVNMVRSIRNPQAAAKRLTTEALTRKSKDDISCIVIRFG